MRVLVCWTMAFGIKLNRSSVRLRCGDGKGRLVDGFDLRCERKGGFRMIPSASAWPSGDIY